MIIFGFNNYKKFVNSWVREQPKGGRGQYRRISQALKLSTVSVSQIFNGPKDINLEHAVLLAKLLELNRNEKKYFLLLVQKGRAGSNELKQYLDEEIQEMQRAMRDLRNRIPNDFTLNETAKATFYSKWQYSAIRLATAISGLNSPDAIADRLKLSRKEVSAILEFLAKNGLCLQNSDGSYCLGPTALHLSIDSPLTKSRHMQWRIKGMEYIENIDTKYELFFTSPMSINFKQLEEFRAELVQVFERLSSRVKNHEADTIACFNVDLFTL